MKCPDIEKIIDFIENRLKKDERKAIKEHLQICKKCYEKYIEFKELKYFAEKPAHVKKETLEKIISMYDEKAIKHYTIILKYTKKVFEILSDSNFELKTDYISAAVITKGRRKLNVKGDTILLTKNIDEFDIELKLEKIKGKRFILSLNIFKAKTKRKEKNIRVILKAGKQEIESIIFPEKNAFEYKLKPENYHLEFYKKENLLFTINLKIKSE